MNNFNFLKDYFSQPGEDYYYINFLPKKEILFLPDNLYFYILILLGLTLVLVLIGLFFIKNKKKSFLKPFLFFVLIILFLTSLRWFLIQGRWITRDIREFSITNKEERSSQMIVRLMKVKDLPEIWYDFYDFLKFSKTQVPKNSKVYVLPANNVFWVWSKYWLYPDLLFTDSSLKADYVLSFNVDLPDEIISFEKFREFGDKKIILKKIND